MNSSRKHIKINVKDLVLEKRVSIKIMPRVLKEITLGNVSTSDLIKFINKRN
jgi:hypothetical protein